VRGVGGERALGVEGALEPAEEAVDVLADRLQLGRQLVERDPRQVAAAAPADLGLELLDDAQLPPGDPAQHQGEQRQHRDERDEEAEQRAVARLAPLGERIGEMEPERAGRMRDRVDAPRAGLGEAGAKRHREARGGRLARAHQHPRRRVDELEDHRVVVDDRLLGEQRQGLGREAPRRGSPARGRAPRCRPCGARSRSSRLRSCC
jgi:hypothetical protein